MKSIFIHSYSKTHIRDLSIVSIGICLSIIGYLFLAFSLGVDRLYTHLLLIGFGLWILSIILTRLFLNVGSIRYENNSFKIGIGLTGDLRIYAISVSDLGIKKVNPAAFKRRQRIKLFDKKNTMKFFYLEAIDDITTEEIIKIEQEIREILSGK